jgi:hypothetical protein
MHYHYLPLSCDLAHDWTFFVYTDGSKKWGSDPLGAAATHPSSRTSIKILVTSTPPTHTMNRAELAAKDLKFKLGHSALLLDNVCPLRLFHKYIRTLHTVRQHPHRKIHSSIISTVQTHTTACITTHIGKINAHNYSMGNDHVDHVANIVLTDNP